MFAFSLQNYLFTKLTRGFCAKSAILIYKSGKETWKN